MAVTVAMPQLGETVTEGTILSWAKQVGDTIAEDEVLLEISTDKVDTEVPSPAAGVIQEILVAEGATVTVGTPLAVIADPAEASAPAAPVADAAPPPPPQPPEMAPAAESVAADSPSHPEPQPAVAVETTPAAAPAASGEAVTVAMPQLGETVTEGTILSWAKQVGDTIAEDEVLLEISTDKVDTEVPSPAAGVIQEILVAEGATVTVGTPLAVIAPAGAPQMAPPSEDDASQPAETVVHVEVAQEPAAAEAGPAAAATAAAIPAAGVMDGPRRGILSPVVRRLATEHGIDLTHVPGTGEGGRITRKDVTEYIEGGGPKVTFEPASGTAPETPVAPAPEAAPPAPVAAEPAAAPTPAASAPAAPATPAPAPSTPAPAPPAPAPAAPPPAPVAATPTPAPSAPAAPAAPAASAPDSTARPVAQGDEVVQLSRLRTRIAENMTNAKRTAAHVWASVEVDYERVERVRQAHKDEFKAREGFSLTYLPFIARAVIDALEEFPVVNSSFRLDEGTQTFHSRVNLGIAVDMNQKGLVVVSVKEADGLRLAGLARGIREKALRAREGNLDPDDISGSTFTITNPGPYGSFMTAPIINVPNVAILSTDTVTKRPVVVTDEFGHDSIAIRHIGYLGLTWDHRAFDGSTAVLFLGRIKESIQTWDWEQELT